MNIPTTPSTPNLILQAIASGLRQKFNANENEIFPSLKPLLNPGWEGDIQIQVSPGAKKPDGGGVGAQEGGGSIIVRYYVDLTVYFRMLLDPNGRSDQILTKAGYSMTDLIEAVKFNLIGDILQKLLFQVIRWEGDGPPIWEDQEQGIVRQSITVSGAYGYVLGAMPLAGLKLV